MYSGYVFIGGDQMTWHNDENNNNYYYYARAILSHSYSHLMQQVDELCVLCVCIHLSSLDFCCKIIQER